MINCFHAGDVLIPGKISMKKWSCIACDQFSSQVDYWDRVRDFVGTDPSTYHMILPEALLHREDPAQRIRSIHAHMEKYLEENLFRTFRRSFIYLERTLENGKIRRGLVGQIDLEEYDYSPGSSAHIRATEATVQERIPPRMEVLRDAPVEFPHVLLLADDRKDDILTTAKEMAGDKVYDFQLMEEGGHIAGWVISGLGVAVVNSAIRRYIEATEQLQGSDHVMSFAVGDGNHSLASAKACWEEIKPTLTEEERMEHPARFALVELENIHDEDIAVDPIHRIITTSEPEELIACLRKIGCDSGFPIEIITSEGSEVIYLSKSQSPLALLILQPVLDEFLETHGGEIDYIHGDDVVRQLSLERHHVGLILPGIDKHALFPGVLQNGVLPRKTFSMGHAREKRYYLEGKMRR